MDAMSDERDAKRLATLLALTPDHDSYEDDIVIIAEFLHQELAEFRERAAKVSDDEEVPAVGEMPPTLIAAVLAQDTVTIEHAIIAAVISTKKAISKRIRALTEQPIKTETVDKDSNG